MEIGVDAGNVDHFTWMVLKGDIDDGLEYRFDFLRDVLVAGLSWSQAKSTTLGGSRWASSPADWANTVSLIRAFWVAQRSGFNKLWWAN